MEWLTGTAALVAAITGLLSAVAGLVGYKAGKSAALKVRDERSKASQHQPVHGQVVVNDRGVSAE